MMSLYCYTLDDLPSRAGLTNTLPEAKWQRALNHVSAAPTRHLHLYQSQCCVSTVLRTMITPPMMSLYCYTLNDLPFF